MAISIIESHKEWVCSPFLVFKIHSRFIGVHLPLDLAGTTREISHVESKTFVISMPKKKKKKELVLSCNNKIVPINL